MKRTGFYLHHQQPAAQALSSEELGDASGGASTDGDWSSTDRKTEEPEGGTNADRYPEGGTNADRYPEGGYTVTDRIPTCVLYANLPPE
jgi:hypothetical protein